MLMSKLMPILLLLAMMLAACGGDDSESAAEQVPAETAVQEEAAPVNVEEDTPAGEELAPTEAPPTEEAAPMETEAPATDGADGSMPSDDIVAQTREPMLIDTPQPNGEAPEVAAGWGESGTAAQTACDHPYFPLRTGTTWSMTGGDGEPINWEVINVEGDLEAATAELAMRTAGLEFMYTFECSADGSLSSYEFSSQGLPALGPEVQIEISEGSGFFLPDPDLLEPGYSWDTSFHTTYALSQLESDVEVEISGEMDTHQVSRVVSTEPVTFEEKTVPGLLIQQDTEVETAMTMLGETVESSLGMGGETVFGRGLGILRQTSFTDFGDFTMEVTEIYVP
jgi:hypothetical protein